MKNYELISKFSDITNNSKNVKKNYIFCAYPGQNMDGRDYIHDSIRKGAKLIIFESVDFDIKPFKKNYPDIFFIPQKELSKKIKKYLDIVYGNLNQKIKLVGITGTNGKTSTAFWLNNLIKKIDSPSEMIGTISKEKTIINTTPDLITLYLYFKKLIKKNIKNIVMEVSSHGVDQGRVSGLNFDYGIFTNLSRDHLDYHKTMENYYNVKKEFFVKNVKKISVINIDDTYGNRLAKELKELNKKVITFGKRNTSNYRIVKISYEKNKMYFSLLIKNKVHVFCSSITGEFNVHNLVGGIIVCLIRGFSIEHIKRELEKLKTPPGRLELIKKTIKNQKKIIFIDYAHTPDGLKKAILAIKKQYQKEITVVFGAGGDRDKGKRKLMGKVVNKYAGYACITSDNPRSENPKDIANQISEYITIPKKIIIDRKRAIEKTLIRSKSHIILIAGKGHERIQIIKNKIIPFSDKDIVNDFVNKQ